MGIKSSIEWTELTWNPVTGCIKISEGCAHCFAERMARRLKAMWQKNILNRFAPPFYIPFYTLQGRGGRNNTPKKVVIYLIKRYAGLSNQEIGKLFGGMHYSAVSKSSARFEKEMAENRRLSTLVNGLMSKVKT